MGSRIHEPSMGDPGEPPSPLNVKIPDGADTLTDGQIVDYRVAVGMKVTKIHADVPQGVTGWIKLDGKKIHETSDRQGNVGALDVGDIAAGIGLRCNVVEVHFENTSGQSLNARYFLVGLP
jgi:hypothetical protein